MDALGADLVRFDLEYERRARRFEAGHYSADKTGRGDCHEFKYRRVLARERPRASPSVAPCRLIAAARTRSGVRRAATANRRFPAHPVAPAVSEPEPLPKPSRSEKIELAIDSLQNYEVIKPIPVLIESLGDKVFVAEAPDLNLSTSGNSIGAAFLMLKEQIVATYEGHRTKRGQDSERARQLAVMDKHIGKTKRHWF